MTLQSQSLLKALGKLDEEDEQFIDEACLQRYVRATFGDIKAAAVQLKGTLQWRKEFKPDLLLTKEIERFIRKEKHYYAGLAPDQTPVIITRKRMQRLLPDEEEGYLRYLIYTLEKAVEAMSEGQEQWVWILDLKGYTSGNSPRLSMTRKTIKILADHYPERLKRVFIVDAPSIFYVLYKVVYPFLDKPTQEKIAFVYSTHYDAHGQPLKGKNNLSEFSTYYKIYSAQHDPESYLTMLKTQEQLPTE